MFLLFISLYRRVILISRFSIIALLGCMSCFGFYVEIGIFVIVIVIVFIGWFDIMYLSN